MYVFQNLVFFHTSSTLKTRTASWCLRGLHGDFVGADPAVGDADRRWCLQIWAAKVPFQGCSALASVAILASVTQIGGGAFRDCSALALVEIPASVTRIDGGAFSGCPALASVVIPDSVTQIGEHAFCGCLALASVEIPASVT